MKRHYRWSMQDAVPALYVLGVVIFLIVVGQSLLSLENTMVAPN